MKVNSTPEQAQQNLIPPDLLDEIANKFEYDRRDPNHFWHGYMGSVNLSCDSIGLIESYASPRAHPPHSKLWFEPGDKPGTTKIGGYARRDGEDVEAIVEATPAQVAAFLVSQECPKAVGDILMKLTANGDPPFPIIKPKKRSR